jgi:hypothetical protein
MPPIPAKLIRNLSANQGAQLQNRKSGIKSDIKFGLPFRIPDLSNTLVKENLTY